MVCVQWYGNTTMDDRGAAVCVRLHKDVSVGLVREVAVEPSIEMYMITVIVTVIVMVMGMVMVAIMITVRIRRLWLQ